MRDPANLSEACIREGLLAHYRVAASSVTFLPIGNDSAA
jgi:hypothetical protein